jgi:serine/threonine-protein kinase RsbW
VDSIFGIHLALEEAFYNAVKHGNKQDTSKQVHIEYMITQEKFEVYVADEGDGFNPDEVPDPRLEENLCRTCGRGMLLMVSFMDVLEYNQKGNRVRMIKYKNKSKNKS